MFGEAIDFNNRRIADGFQNVVVPHNWFVFKAVTHFLTAYSLVALCEAAHNDEARKLKIAASIPNEFFKGDFSEKHLQTMCAPCIFALSKFVF
jgi:hypothetical protein